MVVKEKRKTPHPSQLFTVRVWVESVHPNTRQVRIQVKHVLGGATRTFLRWSEVVEFIEAQLQEHGLDETKRDQYF